jgi:hypothetical protein
MRNLKEVILTVFLLFFWVSRWKGTMKLRSAVAGLTIVEGFAALSILSLVATIDHRRIEFPPLAGGIVFVFLYLINEYFLVGCRGGIAFQDQFQSFSLRKQKVLIVTAICIVLIIGLSLTLSVSAYHRAFNIGSV